MFAVMKTGGKQYKVQAGDRLRVEKLAADAGETVQFNDILMLGGDAPVVGARWCRVLPCRRWSSTR
jgi:large subunit ribosomal protein L21